MAQVVKARRRIANLIGMKKCGVEAPLTKLETHSPLVASGAGRDLRLFSENGNAASHERTLDSFQCLAGLMTS
jgi:hypothetical protein